MSTNFVSCVYLLGVRVGLSDTPNATTWYNTPHTLPLSTILPHYILSICGMAECLVSVLNGHSMERIHIIPEHLLHMQYMRVQDQEVHVLQ